MIEEREALVVRPVLELNHFLDLTLRLRRGPDGVEYDPQEGMCSGEGYLHFSMVTTVGEEAAWWAVGDDHAVPAAVSVQLLRPAHVSKGCLVGRGCALRIGKGMIVSEAVVLQDAKTLCKVTVNFVHFEKLPFRVHEMRGRQGRHGR